MHSINSLDAAYLLVGAIIGRAVQDSFSPHQRIKKQARYFIFSHQLVKFVKRFHVESIVNIKMIRDYVKKGKNKQALYSFRELDN